MKQTLYRVMAAAALGTALSACGSSGTSKSTAPAGGPVGASRYATGAAAPSTTAAPPTTASPTTAVSAPAPVAAAPVPPAPATVMIAQNPKEGAILVDASGRTLYVFELDKGTTSSCTGGCAQVWPGFAAANPSAGPGIAMSKLVDAAGQVPNQVTYNGHLLYHFAGDKAAGDIKGVGVKDWFPIGPDGNKVTIGSSDM